MLNGPSIEAPLSDWDKMVDVNLRGLMYVSKAALPHLVEAVANSPRNVVDVVNISSVAGRVAAAEVAIYSATKFAVTAATEAWRQEFTRKSVRFSVVEPGATDTGLWKIKMRLGLEARHIPNLRGLATHPPELWCMSVVRAVAPRKIPARASIKEGSPNSCLAAILVWPARARKVLELKIMHGSVTRLARVVKACRSRGRSPEDAES
jgi:NAD(P)-dependent dehydrogenase (short-subunit alcohol dehydrogenase family)